VGAPAEQTTVTLVKNRKGGRLRYVALRSLVLLLFCSLTVWGREAKPDFTGTWQYEPLVYGPVLETDQIDHGEPLFRIGARVGRLDYIPFFLYCTDGHELQQKHGPNEVHRTGHWSGKTLVLDTKWINSGVETSTREELSVTARPAIPQHRAKDVQTTSGFALSLFRLRALPSTARGRKYARR
jgi:hypothetical protein